MHAHERIRTQAGQLTQGKKLRQCTLVNASDPPIAPILKGTSNGPAQCGRNPGLMAEPATGFIFANLPPQGNPSDPRDGLPLLDQVQSAIERVQSTPTLRVSAVAGDLGVHDAVLRQALHARGMLTVGIPKSVAPMHPNPRAEEVHDLLHTAG